MVYITSDQLEVLANKIINDYNSFRQGKISREKLKTSVGFQISSLRQYEIEEGQYSNRSVCVIPTSANLIDLVLYYNTNLGPSKYILTIRPGEGNSTIVSKNKLYYLDSNYQDPHESKKSLKTSKKYFSESSEMKSDSGRSTSTIKPPELFPKEFYCTKKNKHCCYINKNHSKDCPDCCKNEVHYI